ncbi:MAG: hypothetical protein DDT22_00905 [candidate division WS2 bacterium]|nr:hypothetical protein [Candidatus Lithacetigena glycinireducens]
MAREYEARRVIPPVELRVPGHTVFETFEFLYEFAAAGTGTDWEVSKSIKLRCSGNYTVRLCPKRTLPAFGDWVNFTFHFSLFPSNVIDAGAIFLPESSAKDALFRIWLGSSFTSREFNWRPGISIRLSTGEISVNDEFGTWRSLGSVGDIRGRRETYFGMSVDFENLRYQTVTIGGFTLDASAFRFRRYTGFFAHSWVNPVCVAVDSSRPEIYVDNVIVHGHFA